MSVPRNVLSRVYSFIRHVDHGTVTLSNAAVTSGGKAFNLSDVPDSTEFTALFDRYRIKQVDFRWLFNANIIGIQSAVPFNTVRWANVIDYNSVGAFASLNDARCFPNCEIHQFPDVKEYHRVIKSPRYNTAVEVANGGSLVTAKSDTGWLNTTANNIDHHGIRYFFEQLSSPYTGSVDLEATYYLEFKDPK